MKSNSVCNYCKNKSSCKRIMVSNSYDCFEGVEINFLEHGKWERVSYIEPDENGNAQYSCSCCGAGEEHAESQIVSYCWNCGAKMED